MNTSMNLVTDCMVALMGKLLWNALSLLFSLAKPRFYAISLTSCYLLFVFQSQLL